MPAVLSPQLIALFASLIEDVAGLHYGAHDRDLFAAKLSAHAADVGEDNLLDYYYRLRYDDPGGEQLQRLIEALVVHESYFFREQAPLMQLVDTQIAPAVRASGRVRVWSAACATGEEPYTLAMILDQRGLLEQVEIVATDISAAAIERARRGRHSARSLRDGHPKDVAARYLEVSPGGVIVSPRIRERVRFSVVNLLDDAAVERLGMFEAILCRNVLIYFQDRCATTVIEHLARRLTRDGLLVVGVSESLLRLGTQLRCEERGGSFFYRSAR
ncbi:MAG: protein-glutamate O-methyltransferase CheR [Kofleriaceae bacterium]